MKFVYAGRLIYPTIMVLTLLFSVFTTYPALAADAAPVFTDADITEVSGINMKLDKTASYFYKKNDWLGLTCTYVRGNDTNAESGINYYFDKQVADSEQKNDLEPGLLLTQQELQKLQNDPGHYTIYESNLSSTRKILLWKNIPSKGDPLIYYGKLMNRVDDRYIVWLSATGTGFQSLEELKSVVEKLEQHGLDLVNKKRGGSTQSVPPSKSLPPREAWQEKVGYIQSCSGTAQISWTKPDQWFPLSGGMEICTGDRFRTLEGGSFLIHYAVLDTNVAGRANVLGRTIDLQVYPDSALSIPSKDKPIAENASGYLEYLKGRFWMMIQNLREQQNYFYFHTPNAISGVKQTELEIIVQENKTTVNVFGGTVEVSDLAKTKKVLVNAGQTTEVVGQGLASEPKNFDPAKLDRWWERTPESNSKILFIIIPAALAAIGITAFWLFRKRRKSV